MALNGIKQGCSTNYNDRRSLVSAIVIHYSEEELCEEGCDGQTRLLEWEWWCNGKDRGTTRTLQARIDVCG